MSILSSIKKAAVSSLEYYNVAFTHPIQTITAGISKEKTIREAVIKPYFAKPLSKQITETVITTAGYASAVVGAGYVAAAAKAGTIGAAASGLIPTTLKGKAIAIIAAPVVVGAVINQPLKSAEAISKTPSALANVGGNIANLAANPTLEGAKNLVKENPVIVGGAAAVAAVVGARSLLPSIATFRQTEAIQEQTEAIKGVSPQIETLPYTGATGLVSEKALPTDEKEAITPETTTITTGKKRIRRARKKEIQSIRQNVKVLVQNRATSSGVRIERYLNERLLN